MEEERDSENLSYPDDTRWFVSHSFIEDIEIAGQ